MSPRSDIPSHIPTLPQELPAPRPAPVSDLRYSTALPFVIVLITLILTTAKDIYIIHQRKDSAISENARMAESLTKVGAQAKYIESLRADLVTLAEKDPRAARIVADFFTPPKPPAAPSPTSTPTAKPATPAQTPPAK